MRRAAPIPPRNGEGDRPAQPGGGGVFAASAAAVALARREHRSGNLPEIFLWRALRARPGAYEFRRQHPIGDYSLDFACLSARLCVEVDGEHHGRGDRPHRDAARDLAVTALGFRTLRIAARDILTDLDAVGRLVVATCGHPLHHPAAPDGPPPRSGEVFNRNRS